MGSFEGLVGCHGDSILQLHDGCLWSFPVWTVHSLSLLLLYSVVKEEIADDDMSLPNVNGRVVCWVSHFLPSPSLPLSLPPSLSLFLLYWPIHTRYHFYVQVVTGEQGSQSGSDTGGSKEKLDSTSVHIHTYTILYVHE